MCPCYTTLPATRVCPAYTFAWQPMYWGEPLIPCFIDGNTQPNYSLQIQGQQTPWYSVCRYTEGSLEQQQTQQGESLAVALRMEPTPDDVYQGGGGCYWQVRASERGQNTGRRRQRSAAGRQQPESVQRNETVISLFTYDIT